MDNYNDFMFFHVMFFAPFGMVYSVVLKRKDGSPPTHRKKKRAAFKLILSFPFFYLCNMFTLNPLMKYPTHTHTHTLMQKQKDDSILSWCLICYRYYYFDRGRGLEVCLLDHKYVYGL